MTQDGFVPLEEAEALFVYGFDQKRYDEAREWLKKDPRRHLVFLEDHPVDAEKILQDPQVRIHGTGNLDPLARYYALCPIHFVPFEEGDAIFEELIFALHKARTNATQDLNPHSAFYHHFYRNMRAMGGDFIAESFFGCFPKVPAVLCGAGASLEKIIEVKDRALIFAGGSALTALGTCGISPHFGAALSPSSFEHDRLWRANLFNVPLFYSPRTAPEALEVWGGEKIAVLGDDPPVVRWFAKQLGFEGMRTQEGPSIMGMLLELAYLMGCDPIIFVGVDLSGPYVKGVEATESPKGSERIWEAEARALGEMAKARKGPTYLNASGGRVIPNIAPGRLSDIHFPLQDFEGQVKVLLEQKERVSEENIEKALTQLRESLERILPLLDKRRNELQVAAKEAFKQPFEGPPVDQTLQIALEKEIAYPLILEEMILARSIYLERIYDNFLAAAGKTRELRSQRFVSIEQERIQFLRQAVIAQLSSLGST